MAKDEIIIKAELQIAKAKTNIKSLKKEIEGLDMRFTESKEKVKQLAFEELKLAKGKQLLINRNKELTVSQSKLGASTGAATSAALELGRVISDAPYGIRGVANNVSQLASQFSFMATAVDKTTGKVVGFNGALKNFGKALKANAVLLLIQGVVAAMDYFAGSTSKAEKQFNSFADTVSKGFVKVAKIESLNNIMVDSNSTIEQQEEALDDLKKMGFDPANEGIEEFIENQKKLVIVQAGIKAIEKELEGIYQERLELFSKFKDEFATLTKIQEQGYGGEDISKAVLEQLKLDKQELDKKEKDLKSEFEKLIRDSLDLDIDKVVKGSKLSSKALKEINPFSVNVKDVLSSADSINKQLELLNVQSAERKLEIELRYQTISLRRRSAKEQKTITDNLEKYKAKVKERYGEDSEKYTSLVGDAEKAASDAVDKTGENYESLIALYEKLYKKRLAALGIPTDDDESSEFDALSHYIDTYKTLMSGVTDFVNGESERQLTIEQNKTNALNEELNNRLLNENLSKEQRKSIQNQILQNDEALRKKQNEIKKKQFNTQKAFNIAMAVVDTYAGASKALNDKTVPSAIARIALASATITSGLLQVATIARQKFQPDSASTPINTASGGGGGGVGDRSFDFNLVGNTQENQLANAIQSQFSSPLKAFVVSKDITTQQELDLNIKSSATF